jgi:hypothetical protein
MSVGGVLRMGSSVGAMVGVLVGGGVNVGSTVAVRVSVGTDVGILVESSITGTGAICAAGVQALLNRNTMSKLIVIRFIVFLPILFYEIWL